MSNKREYSKFLKRKMINMSTMEYQIVFCNINSIILIVSLDM